MRIVGQALLPVGGDLAGLLGDRVDVGGERQRDDVGREAVDDGAGLGAGAAVRLLDGDGLAGLVLPVGGEGGVVGLVELAGRDRRRRSGSSCRPAPERPARSLPAPPRRRSFAVFLSEPWQPSSVVWNLYLDIFDRLLQQRRHFPQAAIGEIRSKERQRCRNCFLARAQPLRLLATASASVVPSMRRRVAA